MNAAKHSVAVIGLGSMGMGAARSCIRAGLNTYGVDINAEALQSLSSAGAAGVAPDCAEFTAELDSVLLLVVNAEQCKRLLFDNGLAEHMLPGTAVMVSATMSADDAKDIAGRLAGEDRPHQVALDRSQRQHQGIPQHQTVSCSACCRIWPSTKSIVRLA